MERSLYKILKGGNKLLSGIYMSESEESHDGQGLLIACDVTHVCSAFCTKDVEIETVPIQVYATYLIASNEWSG